MKNQYFADRRDLLKYDLWLNVAERLPGVEQLTLIPMLTPDDDTGEGSLVGYSVGAARPELYQFLRHCLQNGVRSIMELRECGVWAPFRYTPYKDDEFFTDASRESYFGSIPRSALMNAVVLIDPDVGLETGDDSYMRRRGVEKYLRYRDLAEVLTRCSPSS